MEAKRMELQTIDGGLVQTAEVEVSATRDANGQIVQFQRTVNRQRPADSVPVIRDPANEQLTVAETIARMQALEAQISDLHKQDGQLQLDRANALKAGESTAEISVKQFAVKQDIDTLSLMLEGLKLDIRGARHREAIAQFEQTTADLLGTQSAEQKAFDALQKALSNYKAIIGTIDGLYQARESGAINLKSNYHMLQSDINTRGKLDDVNTFMGHLDAHRAIVNPRKKAYPFAGSDMGINTPDSDPMPDVDPNTLPIGMKRPPMHYVQPEAQED